MRTRTSIAALLMLLGATACGSDGKKDDASGDGDGKIDSGTPGGDGDTPGDGDGDGDGDTCNPPGAEMYAESSIWTFAEYEACIADDACGKATNETFAACIAEKCAPGGDKFFECLDSNLYACETAENGPNETEGPCRTQFVGLACCDESSGCSATATTDDEYLACLDQKCPNEKTGFSACLDEVSKSLSCDRDTDPTCPIVTRCVQWMQLCFDPTVGPDAGTPGDDAGVPATDAGAGSDAGVSDAGATGDASVPPPPPHVSPRLNALKRSLLNSKIAKRVRTAL